MPLNKPTGNMYEFADWLWNPVKGMCPYACSYCYVEKTFRRYGAKQNPLRLDEKELKTDMGMGNFIFVCSGCDLFHPDVPDEWIIKVIKHTYSGIYNRYLWHTKNPLRVVGLWDDGYFSEIGTYLCATIESNRHYPKISKAPMPFERFEGVRLWEGYGSMITIEPILDFDLDNFVQMIELCEPDQVNIGADSGNNHLPEPPKEKIIELIAELKKFTKVVEKTNLRRLTV
jgi:DNA repair photolyase